MGDIASRFAFPWRRRPESTEPQTLAPGRGTTVSNGQSTLSLEANQAKQSLPEPVAFPSVDPGFPAVTVDEILRAHEVTLARIKLCYGADRDTFEREVMPLVRRYAQYVHLLPATPDNYFQEAGGLFGLGLEVAFYALQGTDGHIFSGRSTISARKHLEPRWRQATFIAGLCGEIHLAVGRVLVVDSGGNQWTPYLQGLSPWLDGHKASRYFLKWLTPGTDARALGLFALRHVVSEATLQHLATDNTVVVPHMLASITGMSLYRGPGGEHNVLDELVKRAFALVVDKSLRASADRLGHSQLGAHLERYLVDAMRRLVAGGGSWAPNTERSRVWLGADGLFIVWPSAATDIIKLLEAEHIPGIPKASETLLELLVASGVAMPRSASAVTWHIAPPQGKTQMEALKLCSPDLLLAGLAHLPTALECLLAVPQAPSNARPAEGGASAQPNAPAQAAVTSADFASVGSVASCASGAAGSHATVEVVEAESAPSVLSVECGADGDDDRQLSLLGPEQESQAPKSGEGAGGTGAGSPGPGAAVLSLAAEHPSLQVTSLALDAPLRLDGGVRSALASVVESLNEARANGSGGQGATASHTGGGKKAVPGACAVPAGLFVPLHEFERRGIEPARAVRILAGLSMLHGEPLGQRGGSMTSTVVHDFAGQEVIGVIVLPRFVRGLSTAPFGPQAVDGSTQPKASERPC